MRRRESRPPRPCTPKHALLLLLVTLLAVLVAACDDDETGTGAPSTASRTTPTRTANADPGQEFKELDFPADLVDGQAIGKPDARITLTAFEDFQCPFCLRFTLLNEPVIIEEYVLTGKVRFEFQAPDPRQRVRGGRRSSQAARPSRDASGPFTSSSSWSNSTLANSPARG